MEIFGIPIVDIATLVALAIVTVSFVLTMHKISKTQKRKRKRKQNPRKKEDKPSKSKEDEKQDDAIEQLKKVFG